jgi:hypothetical protein
MRFYGSTFDDVMSIPIHWFFKLYSNIEPIRATEKINYIPIYSWAYLKEGNQRQYRRALEAMMKQPLIGKRADPATYDTSWDQLRSMGKPRSSQ